MALLLSINRSVADASSAERAALQHAPCPTRIVSERSDSKPAANRSAALAPVRGGRRQRNCRYDARAKVFGHWFWGVYF